MEGTLLRRLGLLAIAAAAMLWLAGPSILSMAELASTRLARQVAVGGVIAFALGHLLRSADLGHGRCPRCGSHSARGSVYCAAHRQEIARAARAARAHNRADDRHEW